MRTGIWLTDKHGLLRRKVCDNPSNPQLARFNDGGTDHLGRFYAGTFLSLKNITEPTILQVLSSLASSA